MLLSLDAFEHRLIQQAPLHAERVAEEEQKCGKAAAHEDDEEPERCAPGEELRENAAEDRSEGGPQEGCGVVDAHHGPALGLIVNVS